MKRFLFGAAMVVLMALGLSQSNDCPLSEVVANWNKTIEECVNEAVPDDEDLASTVIEMIGHMFENNTSTINNAGSTSDESSTDDVIIAKAFQSYFCVLENAIKQSPDLAVLAFKCMMSASPTSDDDCEKSFLVTNCFERHINESCSSLWNSRKRRSILSAVNGF